MHSTPYRTARIHRTICLSSAVVGALAWLIIVSACDLDAITVWHALGPLVIVPLSVGLVSSGPLRQTARRLQYLAISVQPLAGLAVAAALVRPQGVVAAALATPWLLVTIALCGWGVWDIFVRRRSSWADRAEQAALCLVLIGGAWTWIHVLGQWRFGFSAEIVQLTGVHFHFAGMALPVLVARAARAGPLPAPAITVPAILASVVLLAVGITSSPPIELVAAIVLSGSAAAVGVAHTRMATAGVTAPNVSRIAPSIALPASPLVASTACALFVVSGLSLFVGMSLAVVYAFAEFFNQTWLDIPTMAVMHGTANGLGFCTAGLVAWSLKDGKGRRINESERQSVGCNS